MNENWTTNPQTGRPIKIGNKIHRKLINDGVLKTTQIDEKILHTIQAGDDIPAIKKILKKKQPLAPNTCLRVSQGKIKVAYKGGRHKVQSQPVEFSSEVKRQQPKTKYTRRYRQPSPETSETEFEPTETEVESIDMTETETETEPEANLQNLLDKWL